MNDHANFWLLAGTAGPLLLLAHILNAARTAVLERRDEAAHSRLLNVVNWIGCGTSIYVLVDSLTTMGNLIATDSATRRWITVVMISISVISLIARSAGVSILHDGAES